MHWLSENWGTVLVALALLGMVAAIVRRLIRDRRQGKSTCGCNCASCPMGGACHKKEYNKAGRHRATLCLPLSGGIQMMKTTVAVSGMVCGMCEAHVNDAISAAFPVKKVSSSRTKGETVILSDANLDRQKLKRVIQGAGYIPLSISEEPYEKRRFFFIR